MSPVISLLGIILAIAFYIWAAVKGWQLLFVAIIASMIVALTGGVNVIEAVTGTFVKGITTFVGNFFIMFLGGALFAQMMADCGAAFRIADGLSNLCRLSKNKQTQKVLAVLTLPIINAILTYGGITSLLVVFLMVTIARRLFEELDIPWKLYAFAVVGSATFTVGLLPGSPQPTNLVPMPFLGTEATAGALLGVIGALVQITLCVSFLVFEVRRQTAHGEGFFPTGEAISKEILPAYDIPKTNIFICVLPCIVLLAGLNIFKIGIGPSLALGCITCYILFFKEFQRKKCTMSTIATGLTKGINIMILMGSAGAFGAVIATVPGYAMVLGGLQSVPGPAPFKVWLVVNIAAGITGSSNGGLSVVFGQMGDYLTSLGIPNPALHRLMCASSIGLDTLPHSPGVVNACGVSKLTHKEIYKYYFLLSVVFTNISALVIALLISLGVGV